MAIITTSEIQSIQFYQMPKAFFKNDKYKELSNNSKIAYMLLRDLLSLSIQKNWVENNGYIFVKMSRKKLCEVMGVSINTATSIFKELTRFGLIQEEDTKVKKIAKKTYICEVEKVEETIEKECEVRDIQDVNTDNSVCTILDNNLETNDVLLLKKSTGLSEKECRELLKCTGNDVNKVIEYYNYTLKKQNVKSIFSYLRACIINNFKIPRTSRTKPKGNFNNFEQRHYKFESLERKLLGWESGSLEECYI